MGVVQRAANRANVSLSTNSATNKTVIHYKIYCSWLQLSRIKMMDLFMVVNHFVPK